MGAQEEVRRSTGGAQEELIRVIGGARMSQVIGGQQVLGLAGADAPFSASRSGFPWYLGHARAPSDQLISSMPDYDFRSLVSLAKRFRVLGSSPGLKTSIRGAPEDLKGPQCGDLRVLSKPGCSQRVQVSLREDCGGSGGGAVAQPDG